MRAVLFLTVVVGLALFLVQNVSLSLPLVFLGVRSQALPLSVWLLLSLVAGAITSFLIASLFQFSNYLAQQQERRDKNRSRRGSSFSEVSKVPYTASTSRQEPELEEPYVMRPTNSYPKTIIQPEPPDVTSYQSSASDFKDEVRETAEDDDWNESPQTRLRNANSWGDEEELVGSDKEEVQEPPSSDRNPSPKQTEYETKQQPTTQSWSGSIYSYGYRDPSNSGVGRTESVYDADYRVITPPNSVPVSQNDWEKTKDEDEEDWGLDDDLEPVEKKPRG